MWLGTIRMERLDKSRLSPVSKPRHINSIFTVNTVILHIYTKRVTRSRKSNIYIVIFQPSCLGPLVLLLPNFRLFDFPIFRPDEKLYQTLVVRTNINIYIFIICNAYQFLNLEKIEDIKSHKSKKCIDTVGKGQTMAYKITAQKLKIELAS